MTVWPMETVSAVGHAERIKNLDIRISTCLTPP